MDDETHDSHDRHQRPCVVYVRLPGASYTLPSHGLSISMIDPERRCRGGGAEVAVSTGPRGAGKDCRFRNAACEKRPPTRY